MGSSLNRDVRNYAVPVRGTIWGVNYNDRSERDIGAIVQVPQTFGDYHDYFPSYRVDSGTTYPAQVAPSQVCPMRILQPHYGGIEECYADISINVAAADSDLTLKLAIGRFQSGSYDRVLTYTDAEMAASWRRIRGSDTPLSVSGGVISADLLNLLDAIPKYGDANWKEDAFVLILYFNKVPTETGTFYFNYLNIHSSVSGIV